MAEQQNPNQQSQVQGADKSAKAGPSSTDTRGMKPDATRTGATSPNSQSKETSNTAKSSSKKNDEDNDESSAQ